jgi:glycosyltransferase involved in cell wall biosynthesis
MSRLLETYPQDQLTILTGSYFEGLSPAEGRLSCKHLVFPATNETGRWGFGRLKTFVDWLLLPVLALYGVWVVIKNRSRVIITIAHGHFFVAAALTTLLTRTPYILMVHDDWVAELLRNSKLLKYVAPQIFKLIAANAAHVYVVTPYMQEMLLEKYQVQSEVQMPAAQVSQIGFSGDTNGHSLKILYAGTGTGAMEDSLAFMVELVRSDMLREYKVADWELHLYTPVDLSHPSQARWSHQRIKPHGWVDQRTLQHGISDADILFLPFSFREEERYATERAFPAKTADYLASGKPILVLAPEYSSVAKYLRRHDCAAVVDKLDQEMLARAISDISKSEQRRRELSKNALQAFVRNHDIEAQRSALNELLGRLADRNGGRAV